MSTLRLTTISNQGGTATVPSDTVINGSAKAWVNFNGTGTVAIRASFNVSSITDNGTGDYTVNFTNAFSDANYSVSGTSANQDGSVASSVGIRNDVAPTTSGFRIQVSQHNAGLRDVNYVCLSVFR